MESSNQNTVNEWESRANDECIADTANDLAKLNVNAEPFVPGQNVFAREFVPVTFDGEEQKGLNSCI